MKPILELKPLHQLRLIGLAVMTSVGLGQAQLSWQTTHTTNGGFNQGQTIVVRNEAKVKVYPDYLDVEEELELATQGTVSTGNDPATLEIVASFSLSPEAAIVGGLLWNGNTILGAKLLSRAKADSLYELQVERNSNPPPRPKDPLLIETIGEGTYRARIYPVALGSTRRIRIRYHIPPAATPKGIYLPLRTLLSATTPQITVHLQGMESVKETILIQGKTARSLQFPRSLILTSADYSIRETAIPTEHGYASLLLQPSEGAAQQVSLTQLPSGGMGGNYTNLYAMIPEVVQVLIKKVQGSIPNFIPTVTATVGNSEHAYDFPISCNATTCFPFVFHGKSTKPWDSTVTWTIYDYQGKFAETFIQMPKVVRRLKDTSNAVLWASSTTPFSESRENPLGPVYGFVDSWASLLALEKDALNTGAQSALAEGGVPRISNDFFQDVLPNYNTQTPIPISPGVPILGKNQRSAQHLKESITWKKLDASRLSLQLPTSNNPPQFAEVKVIDLNGKIVLIGKIWVTETGLLNMALEQLKPGRYGLHIRWQGQVFSTQFNW